MGSTKLPKTKCTSKRLYSNSASNVESMVLECIPNWRSYPRVLRVVLSSLYRYGGLDECLEDLSRIEGFTAALERYASKEQRDEVRAIAEKWYKTGKLPPRKTMSDNQPRMGLTFTLLNQQLFYETTMASNAKLYLTRGNTSASDVKMAIEGGFGNALEIERVRHNAVRKAQADYRANEISSDVMSEKDEEESGGMFEGTNVEYVPPIPMSEDIDDGEED